MSNKNTDFLTAACKVHYKEDFNIRTCPELQSLRHLKDCFISDEEKQIFNEIAPKITQKIVQMSYSKQKLLFAYIYYGSVKRSADYVEKGEWTKAYYVLRNSTQKFAKHFLQTQTPEINL